MCYLASAFSWLEACTRMICHGLFSASGASRGWCPPWCTHEKRRWSVWRRTRSCSTLKRWCRVWRRCEGNTLSCSTPSWTALSRPGRRRSPACSARAWRTSSWGWERRRYLKHSQARDGVWAELHHSFIDQAFNFTPWQSVDLQHFHLPATKKKKKCVNNFRKLNVYVFFLWWFYLHSKCYCNFNMHLKNIFNFQTFNAKKM